MTQTKRWTITYTKHLTQKRKVYHDGALEVSGTCDKVMLYDDCKNLIASRFLKQDEIVECGATLAFGTHLVDIGEPEGDHKSQTCPNVSRKDVKLRGSPGGLGQKKVKCESRPSQNYSNTIDSSIKGNKKSKLQSRSLRIQLNAMHSKITVGSETKLGTSGVLQTQQDATQTTRKEWNALYTTQKTQKIKKYHDGVLRLAVCGSHMNQVSLLNEEGAVLSSKYLKSAECVGAGSTYEFPDYLVEIGDPWVSLGDDQLKVPLGQVTCSSSSNTRKFATPKKDPNNKPLHNGLLDIILTNDQHKDPLGQITCSGSSSTRKFATPTKDPNSEPVLSSEYIRKGKPEEALGCGSSNALELSTSMGIIRNQQLRDACQIISILKKPLPEENFGLGKLPVEYATSLCSSDSIQMSGNNKSKTLELTMPGTIYSKSNVLDKRKCGFQEPEIRVATQGDTSARPCLNSITTQIVPATVITLPRENEENQAVEGYPTSSNDLSRTLEPETPSVKLDMQFTGSECVDKATFTAGPYNSYTNTCTLPVTSQKNASVSVFSGECSKELADSSSDIVPVKKEFGFFSNVEQHTADSPRSSLKENISKVWLCNRNWWR